jgi:endoglucanase
MPVEGVFVRQSDRRGRIDGICEAITVLCVLILFWVPARATESAFVRVNQLGYEIGTESRAYLMAPGPESNSVFHVVGSTGVQVFAGPIGAQLGSWGRFKVYALDFKISEAGTYTMDVDGPLAATSPGFRVGTAKKIYSQALTNALRFYENERDGEHFIKTPLRTAAGHLLDRRAIVYDSPQFDSNDLILGDLQPVGGIVDASGGWWDAGDYLKFVETHSYTLALMLIGIRDFPKQMGAGGGAANFTNEAKFGLHWLQKMWDDENETLYYQVGIGTDFKDDPNLLSDHDLWRLPQVDDTLGGTDPALRYVRHRPVFVSGRPGSKISPNLAGRLVADFAECSQVFRESQESFANACLIAAEHIFALADPSPSGDLLTTAPFDFYGETEWRDDMELGATELYFALATAYGPLPSALPHTDPEFYLRQGAHWAHAYITGPNDAADTLNLYDVSGLAHFELFRAISAAGHPKGLEVAQTDLLRDLRKQLENAVRQANSDPFGFGFPWNTYDTTTHGAGLSVMAREYSFLTQSKSFDDRSRGWAGNILGANAWGSSFIVGNGAVFPNCMQHQVANIAGSLDGGHPVLRGAVVEGPNSFAATGILDGMRKCPPGGDDPFKKFNANGAVYKDDEQSYSTVEPAIDLSASSFLMFAWRIAGAPATLVPSDDISPTLDEPIVYTPNPQWPPRRARAKRPTGRNRRLSLQR